MVKSGVHSAPERTPGVWDSDTFVALIPELPLVAPYGTPGVRVVPLAPPLTLILAADPESRTAPPPPPPPGPCLLARLNAWASHASPPLPPCATTVSPLVPPACDVTIMLPPAPPPPPASFAVPLYAPAPLAEMVAVPLKFPARMITIPPPAAPLLA